MTTQVHDLYTKTVQDWLNTEPEHFNHKLQERAINQFNSAGIPTKKWEDWKYTNVSSILLSELKRAKKTDVKKEDIQKHLFSKDYRVVFSNGIIDKSNTLLPKGVSLELLDGKDLCKADLDILELSLSKKNESFSALNLSCTLDVVKLSVEKNIFVDGPITLLHLATEDARDCIISPKVIIKANQSSNATFIEHFTTQANIDINYTLNHHTTCLVESNAKLRHIKVQDESHLALHIGKVHAEIDRDGDFHSFTFSVGAKVSRNNIEANLNATGANTHVDGLYTLRDDQHNDNFSVINHNKAHTNSGQLFKGILDKNSRGIFTGKIVVHRDAQQVESSQLNKNLLLSKKAHVDTRPQLEVYADDVKCAHGATVGQISEEEIFYLESRGIPKERAQKILCHAFAGECLDKIEDESTRLKLGKLLFDKFEKFALDELNQD